MNRCERSSTPFACGSRAVEDHPARPPAARRTRRTRLRRAAARRAIAASRSHTSFSGSAPNRSRFRPRPQRMSGASLEKINAPAIARDQHSSHGHDLPAPLLPMPDRDQLPRLPQIALHQLPRPIDRPLKRPGRPRTAGGPPGRTHRRSTCRPHSQARPAISRNRCDWIRGSACSCSQIHSLNGSSFDPVTARAYFGGSAAANARATVSRCNPVRATDLPDREPLNRSTTAGSPPTAPRRPPASSSLDHDDRARVKDRPDNTDPAPGGPLFNRRRWVSIHPAPTGLEVIGEG